ncbi:MAG: asparagine synthase (glutamine-hydrolyzing) [Planctomycetales bacterium]|nr:asparagine synthase (glutamine-hydrolyzing) [Planctomycetales bacterium]
MCGIAGCIDRRATPHQLEQRIGRMVSTLSHRGPDDEGCWLSAGHGVALGHRRLAIRDLSPAGRQPMVSASGDWVIVFNGEIYNCEQLRAALPHTTPWRGQSDTEVLLNGFSHWGLLPTVERCHGMFAIAAWNRRSETITLIRDRLGIKPLYYSVQGHRVLWASELKGLLCVPEFEAEINRGGLQQFLRYGYIAAPHTILRETYKLPPGCWIELHPDRSAASEVHCYWDADAVATQCREQPLLGDDRELQAATETQLRQIVREHLVSDVPVGAFLSSGIDSSLITSYAQDESTQALRSYSIGFYDSQFDEAPIAREIARCVGTQHDEYYLTTEEVAQIVPRWCEYYCEPFSDTSGLPTLAVSHYAGRHVRVVLSGDGGDELFAGYRRYQQTAILSARLQRVPATVRHMLRQLLGMAPAGMLHRLTPLQRMLRPGTAEGLCESVRKTRSLLSAHDRQSLYECLSSISFNANADRFLSTAGTSDNLVEGAVNNEPWHADWPLLDNMQLWDSQVYLPNDILHKVDIASMSAGLEVRVPLLDHRVYEWAWRLPCRLKQHDGQGKIILRRLLRERLPQINYNRTKRGFSAPMDNWLRSELRDWAESLVSARHNPGHMLLNQQLVDGYWQDFVNHRAGHARIWPVIVFLDWCQHYLPTQRQMSGVESRDEYRVRNTSSDSVPIRR